MISPKRRKGKTEIEQALQECEDALQQTQHLAKIGSWKWVIATNSVQWSDELCQINGHDPKLPVPGFAEMAACYTPQSWERLNAAVTNALQNGVPYDLELELVREDGIIINTLARGEVDKDASGKTVGLHGIVQDITERLLAEKAIRTSEEYFRAIFDLAIDGILLADLETKKFTIGNRSICHQLGYSQEEIKNVGVIDIHPEKDLPYVIDQFERQAKGEFTLAKDIPVKRKDGTVFYADVNSTTIKIAEKTYLMGFFRDITERKQAEGEHKANIRFLESLERVDHSIKLEADVDKMLSNIIKEVFSIFDSDRAWLLYPCDPDAPSFRVPVEMNRPEYPGANVQGLDVPMTPDVAQNMREALEFDDPVTYIAGTERPINKVTAEQFGVLSQMFIALYPKVGKPWVFGMHQCSSPRIWTKEDKRLFKEISRRISDGLNSVLFLRELQGSEERFRRLAENARDMIYRMSLPEGKYEYVSPAAFAISGYSPEEFYKTPLFIKQIIHPDWHKYFDEQWTNLIRGELPLTYEYQIIHKSGEVRWLNQRNILLRDNAGNPAAIEGIVTDITGRKQAEMKLLSLYRVIKMLGDVNQTLVHVADEQTLLNEVCRIVVEVGGYRLAWVGYVENDEEKTIRPVAHAGFESGYLEKVKLTWADTERGRGPGGVAIRTGKPSIASNIATDPSMAPWREDALKRGYQAIIAIPLKDQGSTFGVIGIYSTVVNAFSDEESKILDELASDLAYGISAQRICAEHKLLEEVQRKNEAELREAQRIGRFGNFEWDLRTGKITWSEEFFRIYGFDPKQSPPSYEEHLTSYSPESAARLDAAVKKSIRTGDPYVIDLEQVGTDGTRKWIAACGEVKRDANNEIVGIRGTAQDITERKQLEDELNRTNEENINYIFEGAGDGLMLSEIEGDKIFTGNKAICRMLGYSLEEIKKLGIKDIQSEEAIPHVMAQFKKQLKGEIVSFKDLSVKRKDGSVFFADVNATSIVFGGKKYMMSLFHDNTERLLGEKQLQESEKKFRAIFMSSSDAIMTLEPPTWKFTSGNPATVAMFGAKDEAEFVSYEPWKLSPELQMDGQNSALKAKEMIEKAMQEGSNRFEWLHKRLNGEEFCAEVLLSRIEQVGKVYLTALVRDLTQQRLMEEKNKKINELKEVNEIKNEFLAMASHELRTPLAIIEQGVSLVLEQLSGPINPKQKEVLETAQINIDRLTRLINDLLNIEKIESHKVVSQLQSIDIVKTVEDIIKTLQPQAEKNKIDLSLKLKPKNPLKISADPDKLNEVFNNLLSNALKFTSEQGKIAVEIVEKDTFVEISIRDTGKGIAKENLPRLFSKFEQFGRSIGPGAKGTGLGLAISKGLVELFGGKIWVESELGKGSTFTFTIPKEKV
ncbi:MAG: PAS domain S-box protein [Candidatus Margulisiibacteriota bacterium]